MILYDFIQMVPMMFSKKTWLLTTVLLVTHGVPVYAMEPVVLSNDISVSRADPLDDGGRLPRDNLFWEVKQAELGGAGQCVASKNMTAGQSIRVTAGNFAISQVELINNRWRLPTSVATVPITLSFDRAIQPMVGTAIVAGPDRLQFALPDPAVAYDVFQQASALRASITLGNDVLARTFDLSGLKTALAETELCADIAPSKPIPERIKRAAPPPIPDRDPSPITENLRRAGPEISVAPGTIPPLEWPDVDPESVRMSDVPLKTPFPKSRVHPVVANPPTLNDAYSPSLARQNDVGTTGVVIPMKSNATAATSEPLPYEVRPQLRVEGPAVSTPSALPVTRRAAPDQIVQVVTVDTFRARKGEGLRDVLRRWADRAGVDLVWTMPGDILLDQDFSYVGVFSTAVKGLLADYPQSGITTTLNHDGVRSFDRQPFI